MKVSSASGKPDIGESSLLLAAVLGRIIQLSLLRFESEAGCLSGQR
ncbi:hypothetical protein KBZ33_00885 [Cyanobium sp. Cruz-8D1]|nr:hypothetical protein [Cyanobium sp. Cruz-8D1]MCP9857566.1 hypothetical protein [Cyanobium sp. Cruz-8H5]MCP9864861.1 hypothetical protein [Cyanobium sp. Cruz-8D1]